MKIDLKALPPEGADFSGEDPVSVLAWDYGPRDVVRPCGPARYAIRARRIGDELVAIGSASAEFEGSCCRCGGPLRRVYSADVDACVEVAPDAAEADLTSELREAILLALPNHPVCSDDCPGPAPAAASGGLGEAPGAPEADSPWGALDDLFGGTTQHDQRPRSSKTPKRR